MNRLVLIGNGFDLAHGLKTSYADFINWYCDERIKEMGGTIGKESIDILCSFQYLGEGPMFTYFVDHPVPDLMSGYGLEIIREIIQNGKEFKSNLSPLFKRIIRGVNSKTWAGIEQDYYDLLKEYAFRDRAIYPTEPPIKALNQQLLFLQEKLIEYLGEVSTEETDTNRYIKQMIYAPIKTEDIAVEGQERWVEYVMSEMDKDERKLDYKRTDYGLRNDGYVYEIGDFKNHPWDLKTKDYPDLARLPQQIMLLNFNYTKIPEKYLNPDVATIVPIHGELDKPESVIFGYGDELDEKFKELKAHKNNACLSHIKSIRYLEAPNYRKVLSFIESAPFQVLIMGHSCGNSDRTLLNTIFEHKNCVSIKPYYYVTDKKKKTDNYIELVQNISRNFTDMKPMRDRVVNKTQCKPLAGE